MNHRGTEDTEDTEVLPNYLNEYSHAVIGAAIEVHRTLGPGYLESVDEDAMRIELRLRGIPFDRQAPLPLSYKGHLLPEGRVDLLVYGELVVELKAIDKVHPIHRAQVLSYLKAGVFRLGLITNFNLPALREGIARVILF